MKNLTEKEILSLLKEEWNAKVNSLKEQLDVEFKVDGYETNVLSPNLKLKNKKTGVGYIVDSVNTKYVVLKSFDGKSTIKVSNEDLERLYDRD